MSLQREPIVTKAGFDLNGVNTNDTIIAGNKHRAIAKAKFEPHALDLTAGAKRQIYGAFSCANNSLILASRQIKPDAREG